MRQRSAPSYNTSPYSTAIVAPALFPLAFCWAIAPGSPWPQPGAPFLLAAGLLAIALVAAVRVTRVK